MVDSESKALKGKFLLDTQIFIRWMEKSRRLPQNWLKLLVDIDNQVFLSVASVWEMVIKQKEKKLRLPTKIESGIRQSGFGLLPIELVHVLAVAKLPLYHQDPFDRILIAQAQVENLTLISSDKKMARYKIKLLSSP